MENVELENLKKQLEDFSKTDLKTSFFSGENNLSLYDCLVIKTLEEPNKKVNVYGNFKRSYKYILNKVNKVASSLTVIGVKKGDKVTVALDDTPNRVYSMFAINKLGAVINPMTPSIEGNYLVGYLNYHRSHYVIVNSLALKNLCKQFIRVSADKVIVVNDKKYFLFKDLVEELIVDIKNKNNFFISWNNFMNIGRKVKASVNSVYNEQAYADNRDLFGNSNSNIKYLSNTELLENIEMEKCLKLLKK